MRLESLEVQSCCYFISLRTGTKLIGFISLLGCFLASALAVWELIVLAKVEKYIEIMLVVNLIAQTLQMITAVFLLLGAYQEKAKFLPPWLVSTLFSAVLEVVFMPSLVGKVFGIQYGTFTQWLIVTIFLLVDDIYGLLVVFSYYRTLAPQGRENVM